MKDELIVYRTAGECGELISACGEALSSLGIYGGQTSVSSSYELLTVLSESVKRSNLILALISCDEYIRVKKIVSKSLGIDLVKSNSVSGKLGKNASDRKYLLHDHFPKGAVILDSPDSLYSGYYLKSGSQCIIFAPLDGIRTPAMLQKAGIKVQVNISVTNTARFIGVSKREIDAVLRNKLGMTEFSVSESNSEAVLMFQSEGDTEEIATESGRRSLADIKKFFGASMYSDDSRSLVTRIMEILSSQDKKIAVAETENAGSLVSYLAGESISGEHCKVIRLSSAKGNIISGEELSELVKRVHEKSGFEYVVALGGEGVHDETGESFIYGAYINESGIMLKRIWKRKNEESAAFKLRCAKELMLVVYNDLNGELSYKRKSPKSSESRALKRKKRFYDDAEKTEKEVIPAVNALSAEEEAEIAERKARVAPELDRKTSKNMMLFMLAVAAVVIIIAIFICREPSEDTSASASSTTTTASVSYSEPTQENTDENADESDANDNPEASDTADA